MTISYFIKGSLYDEDNDFELTINGNPFDSEDDKSKDLVYRFKVILKDISSEDKLSTTQIQPSFLLCLNYIQEFISENDIKLYSKVLTSTEYNTEIDHELERFIAANANW